MGCSEDELHGLGARIVADTLRERGWLVLFLGAATPPDALEGVARSWRPTLVALSTTRRRDLPRAREAVHRARAGAPGALVVVGGQAYRDPERDKALVGADLVAPDARSLLECLG